MEGNSFSRKRWERRSKELHQSISYCFDGGIVQTVGNNIIALIDAKKVTYALLDLQENKSIKILLMTKDDITFNKDTFSESDYKEKSVLYQLHAANEFLLIKECGDDVIGEEQIENGQVENEGYSKVGSEHLENAVIDQTHYQNEALYMILQNALNVLKHDSYKTASHHRDQLTKKYPRNW